MDSYSLHSSTIHKHSSRYKEDTRVCEQQSSAFAEHDVHGGASTKSWSKVVSPVFEGCQFVHPATLMVRIDGRSFSLLEPHGSTTIAVAQAKVNHVQYGQRESDLVISL